MIIPGSCAYYSQIIKGHLLFSNYSGNILPEPRRREGRREGGTKGEGGRGREGRKEGGRDGEGGKEGE